MDARDRKPTRAELEALYEEYCVGHTMRVELLGQEYSVPAESLEKHIEDARITQEHGTDPLQWAAATGLPDVYARALARYVEGEGGER
jgi:hypothetical protein